MKIFFALVCCIFFIVLAGCTNEREPENSTEVDPEAIFLDYQVKGEEGNDLITVLLQFKYDDEYGGTLLLEKPGKVELDGEQIPADSSKVTGPFYEIQKPVVWLNGTHQIVFTDNNGEKFTQLFDFRTLSLLTPVPDTIHRADLNFEFPGGSEDYIRLLLTDTSFTGNGINRLDTVRNGRLVINKKDLENLANGPVQLELIREEEKQLLDGDRERGRLVFHIVLNGNLSWSTKLAEKELELVSRVLHIITTAFHRGGIILKSQWNFSGNHVLLRPEKKPRALSFLLIANG
jgi:hypothetical protein